MGAREKWEERGGEEQKEGRKEKEKKK